MAELTDRDDVACCEAEVRASCCAPSEKGDCCTAKATACGCHEGSRAAAETGIRARFARSRAL
jgi:hypothetical protein